MYLIELIFWFRMFKMFVVDKKNLFIDYIISFVVKRMNEIWLDTKF